MGNAGHRRGDKHGAVQLPLSYTLDTGPASTWITLIGACIPLRLRDHVSSDDRPHVHRQVGPPSHRRTAEFAVA